MDCPVCGHRRCLICGADPYHDGSGCPPPAGEEDELGDAKIASLNIRYLSHSSRSSALSHTSTGM